MARIELGNAPRFAVVVVAVAAAGLACSGSQDSQLPTEAMALGRFSSSVAIRTEVEHARLLSHVRQRVEWLGVLHNEALAAFHERRNEILLASLGGLKGNVSRQRAQAAWTLAKAERCALAGSVIVEYGRKVDAGFGLPMRSAAHEQQLLWRHASVNGCDFAPPMAIFSGLRPIASAVDDEPDVTDDGILAGELVANAAALTDGSAAAVATAMNAVLASFTNLQPQDLEYAAGIASIAVSSHAYWESYAGGGGAPPDSMPEPMLLFRRAIPAWAAYLGFVDTTGCLAAAGAALATGTRKNSQLLGACGWGALGASVAAAA